MGGRAGRVLGREGKVDTKPQDTCGAHALGGSQIVGVIGLGPKVIASERKIHER